MHPRKIFKTEYFFDAHVICLLLCIFLTLVKKVLSDITVWAQSFQRVRIEKVILSVFCMIFDALYIFNFSVDVSDESTSEIFSRYLQEGAAGGNQLFAVELII